MSVHDPKQCPIAIVGASAIFPGSVDATGFWRDIFDGNDLVTDIPSSHWLIDDYYDPDPSAPDKTYAHRGAFLPKVDFDPLEWGVPPSIVPATDTTQLLALIVAKRVLQDATQGNLADLDTDRVSCILGVTSAQELLGTMVNRLQRPVWTKALREMGYAEEEVEEACDRIANSYVPWQESSFPGLLGNVVAGRIANRLDLGGTNCVTDAACASSFSALSMAVNELWLGQSDLAITGGADTMNDIFMYMCFSKTPALSKSGECRPFSDKADGTLLGEGLGLVALKRLHDAEAAGDRIYGVLRGIGSSSDGRSKSVYAPVSEGQAKALRRSYAQAGYGPETVELVEAHGTGTKAGDAAEFGGLRLVFDDQRPDRQWCALGTVKSQVGHTKAAAGAAGLFKVLMALHHRVLPPTIKIDRPNPNLEIDGSPFYLNDVARPWVRASDHPRRGSVSSFGFGGTNFHLTLEEYTGSGNPAWRLRTAPTELVLLSATTPTALAQQAQEWAARSTMAGFLPYAARTTQESFDSNAPARLAVVAKSEDDLKNKLLRLAERIQAKPDDAVELPTGGYYANGRNPGRVAFLFPGQGSQYTFMGADQAMHYPAALAAFDAAADLDFGVEPLHRVVFPLPAYSEAEQKAQEAHLRATEWAQPAIGVTSLALLGLLRQLGVQPDVVGGHSYGEITALCAAGALSEADCLRVARRRGELMAQAASGTAGAMLAAPMTADAVRPYLQGVSGVVIANDNAPNQVVVSGTEDGVAKVARALEAAGLEPKRLTVATAFHSPIVADSVGPFRSFLDQVPVNTPRIPAFHNATAQPHEREPGAIREALATAIAKPVHFVDQVRAMYRDGVRTFVEVGPGHVLTNLVGEILSGEPHLAVPMDRRKQNGVTATHHALGRLAVAGVRLDLATLWQDYAPVSDPHTADKPRLALAIDGANYDKPYPPPGGSADLPAPNPVRTGAAKAREPEPQVVERVVEKIVPVASPTASPVAAHSTGAPMSNDSSDPWILAFQEAQRATVEAHTAYQQAMANSHEQFLRTVEASMTGLQGMLGGQPGAPVAAPLAAPAPRPVSVQAPVMPAAPPMPAPAPMMTAPPPAAAAPVVMASPASAPVAPSVDLEALLLDVVADKTGYPADMLDMSMALESDLGIDSIKRVEILSAVREAAPGLPEVDTAEMAKLNTLGQVVDHLRSAMPAGAPTAMAASAAAPIAAAATAAAGPDLEALLLQVVADKTGYPADMLDMSMALESDLGIDSIKRVEILSAVREAAPGLPEVDTAEMAKLNTLGQVVDHLRGAMPAGAAPAPAVAASPAPTQDLEALLLQVVADKTGYPADMLDMSMALESDLGIDSIKRVEILSAVREAAPGLPEVDTAEMAKLNTLGQVVEHLRSAMPAGAPTAMAATAAAHLAPAPTAAPGPDLEAQHLQVVADKTGYPADMLDMSMALESDLGIDSIKRVEILSAVREAAPGLPEVDTAEMAKLNTLGQVVDHLRGAMPAGAAPAPAVAASPAPTQDLEALLLQVVADKTGYPADMLDMSMALESDLGIDSIKRVEILSAVREAAPGLPEVDTAEMAKLNTLGQVVDHLRGAMPAGAAPAPAVAASPAPTQDLEALLLQVVADKTGYPADMLDMSMALESDLGIDSIKRVEILSAVREAAPGLPEVDTAEMAKLNTLGQVVDHLRGSLGPVERPVPLSPAPLTAAAPAAPTQDLEALLLAVVADKTGYPADMLDMSMALESDLGIDSIKRVEILSAVRDAAPGLPEVDTAEMAKLNTLGQVVDHLRGNLSAPAPTPTPAPVVAVPQPDLGRWRLEVVETPPAGMSLPGLGPNSTIAVVPPGPTADAMIKALADQGLSASATHVPSDNVDVVVFVGSMVPGDPAAVHRQAFLAAKSVAKRFAEEGGLFVTVQDTGGDFGLYGSDNAWLGGIAGLTKTVAQEWPKASCKAIDVQVGHRPLLQAADAVVQELLGGGPEVEVGLRANGRRCTLRSVPADVTPSAPALNRDSVVVASGGARGVTAHTLIGLARAYGGKYVLLGRTPLKDEPTAARGAADEAALKQALLADARAKGQMPTPADLGRQVRGILSNREIQATLFAIESAGGQARYVALDVTDAAALEAALGQVRADWGPIAGVIHGAGVLADKLVADKTVEQFDRVFQTKVEGLRALLAATGNDPLRLLVMFASVAGRCGNRGQADYAMANEVLAKVAALEARLRGPECLVKAMQWGPWAGGMVTPQLKAHFAAQGVPLIGLDAGAKMLVDEVADRAGSVELVLGGEPRMAPLADGEAADGLTLRLRADRRSHPYLSDHSVNGTPVVPIVMVLEWFARAAAAFRPGLSLGGFREIKVLRGIQLKGFDNGGDWFDVRVREVSNGTGAVLALELASASGALHYSALCDVVPVRAPAPRPSAAPALGPAETANVYDGTVLFHGTTFQVIRSLDGASDEGMAATLSSTADVNWADEPWLTDPAALDGGLQMALLFGKRMLGGASLPMSVDEIRTFRDGPPAGPLRAVLRGQTRGRDRTISDIVFIDQTGSVVHEILGVQAILRPDA